MKAQQFLSIFYNPVYRVTKSSSFYQFPFCQFLKRQQVSPISHIPTYQTKISQQLLLISYNPTYRITKIQQFLSFFTTAFISLQNLISFCQFLTPLITPSVFTNFIQPYLSGHKRSKVTIIFLQSYLSFYKISSGFTNFVYPYLSDRNLPTIFINSLQPN